MNCGMCPWHPHYHRGVIHQRIWLTVGRSSSLSSFVRACSCPCTKCHGRRFLSALFGVCLFGECRSTVNSRFTPCYNYQTSQRFNQLAGCPRDVPNTRPASISVYEEPPLVQHGRTLFQNKRIALDNHTLC